ncbi:hypothetical protein ABE530_05070 [Brucella sp. TWI559]
MSISRVSTLVFADGKVLTRISNGGDLTTGRFEAAISWFSDNWPTGVDWPSEIVRPSHVSHSPDYPPSGEAGAQSMGIGCAPASVSGEGA